MFVDTQSNRKRRRIFAGLMASATLAGLAAGCKSGGGASADNAASANPATPHDVASATVQNVRRLVPVTGSITALQSVTLMPKVTANVLSVVGREGDPVHAGEVVVQLDPIDFQTQLQQAQANLQDARAKLTQAQTSYRLQTTQSTTGVQNAESALAAAQANLAIARQPQRNEQVQQSEISVRQAQANYDKAVADRKRYEYLVKEGAAAQNVLDDYLTAEKVQLANLDNAKQSLQISNTGGRLEDIHASEEQVRQAKIALQLARSNVQQNAVKADDIRSAQAAVAQNEANVAAQKQQVAYCTIRTPIDGIIAARTAEPGTLAGPGAMTFSSGSASSSGGSGSVMQVVAVDTLYFQAQVPETDVADVQPNKVVEVHVDAFPGRTFAGTVSKLFPSGSTSSRNFSVRVTLPNSGRLLRPGMFARADVVADSRRGIVVPKDAIVGSDGQYSVFVADGSHAVRHSVKVGIQTDTTSEILSGVSAGDSVIVSGQDSLKDGSPIHVAENMTKEASR